MSLLSIVAVEEVKKLEKTKWWVFCGTPCNIITLSLTPAQLKPSQAWLEC
jgi:hypothetical protein